MPVLNRVQQIFSRLCVKMIVRSQRGAGKKAAVAWPDNALLSHVEEEDGDEETCRNLFAVITSPAGDAESSLLSLVSHQIYFRVQASVKQERGADIHSPTQTVF